MPGPQGPEINKTEAGSTPSVISSEGARATEIDKAEPPKTSPIQDNTKATPVQNANASPDTTSSTASKQGGGATAQTTTTSNQGQRVAGYRYYRDLGQK